MLLEVKNLRTEFRNRSSVVRAVDDVSLEVDAGQTLAVVGESGSGKSVTALSIMGLIKGPVARVAGGEVVFAGQDLLKMSPRAVRALRGTGVAMIFQDPMTSLNPSLTVGRQITESLRLHLGMNRKAARRRAVELLELVGISEPESRLSAYPHQFSGGMRQRVMIAIALACDPRLIVADEITTALDVTIQAQILELLRKLTEELGTAVILITHDLGIVAGMSERVNVMYGGQVVESAATVDLFAQPKMPYSWGLLASIPRLDQERAEKLIPITGAPPDMADPPPGCRYQPRCPFARQICSERIPELLPVGSANGADHLARCWGASDVPEGGWLRDVDWREAQRVGAEGMAGHE
ncbi:ABC transporter ATP-binding protein [Bogoriella caseilytica]|uniref:Oligopeptide transport system ATP-binding protein n=1 Tax=Bogoriella caseilytica TaxID=56055 RepID=A0A3N2BDH7_9MICO|nr:ABC transporter ATP-binding protein [Bogoriella caseilytica]ROR73298.1 oligopeptide transport system ATP-binding protein [Bogoriella caseilytica]